MTTGPFTELDARRLGPVRRYFAAHPRAMDLVVMVLVGLPGAANGFVAGQTRNLALSVVIALAGGAAMAWRRSRPLVVAGVICALGVLSLVTTGGTSGMEAGLGFALYAVTVAYPSRTSWLVAGATAAVLGTAAWLWEMQSPDPTAGQGDVVLTDDRWGTITGTAIFVLLALAIGNAVRNRRQHLAELIERGNALARDRDRQGDLARAAERSRISREMHDVVAHSLTVMISLADGAAAALDRAPDRSRVALSELSATGRTALGDMRRVLGALHDDAPLRPVAGDQDLEGLVERFRTAGLPVRATGLRLVLPEDTGLRLAVYRAVQESLTNVLRHAPGTARVDVTLSAGPGRWTAEISDHGAALPPADRAPADAVGAGQGLIGMRERAALLGGTVEAGPWEHGWRVTVTLPHDELPHDEGER
ncbi:histidine kinase [Actinotalea sp.]|uniref:sensor histidine kinase n=1 Tax=Actinotalea sp. TaxID=1872145 RepID=UPI002C2681F7|nr:histidine kinase [Actinotalea sp.]HQY34182.1 histidine kinase [Actinotalea sp.]HRA51376.1 histidine kinase [Actinotalea sp.]